MSSSKSVQTWCSDALHDLLGYSDGTLASYLADVAQKASSHKQIVQVLEEGGQGAGDKTRVEKFAKDLYRRCHPQKHDKKHSGKESTSKKQARGGDKDGRRSNQSSIKNDKDDDDTKKYTQKKADDDTAKHDDSVTYTDRSKRKRHRRTADDSDDDDGSNDQDDKMAIQQKRQQAEERREERRTNKDNKNNDSTGHKEESLLTKEERVELDRDQDLQERDEFVKRMLDRDESKTKKLTKTEQEEEDRAHQQRIDNEDRLTRGETVLDETTGKAITLDQLREESRRFYLKKREERELALLKQSLQDEEVLFKDVNLTEAEKKRIALGKQILNMVEKRDGKEDPEEGFYRLPDEYDDKDSKANQDQARLKSRYQEEKQEKTEQQLWEESQTQKAMISGNKKAKKEDDYDLVFEDQIDFVMQGTKKGYDRRDKKKKASSSRVKEEEEKRKADPLEPRAVTEHEKILVVRKKLPVFPYREDFLAAVKDHQVLILVGETGSGKTTQIPQYLHEIGYSEIGKIGCTQPRRVAAMSVAARVAQEMDVKLGHEVGYSIRFENCTNQKTIIQYMTDGMLLREILTAPDLAGYSCMVIDEAHERTLATDILFTLLKDIVRFRDDLRLVISSATLDAEKFSKFFDEAPIFMIPGRMFPVDIYYTKAPEADYVDAAVVTVLQIHVSQPLDGDVLVFLTGQEEIETAAEVLTQRTRNLGSRIRELIICPIYANLPSDQQAKIFEKTPKGARKVVLATNIAETSLTINGIKYVIDTGFNKQKSFDAKYGMESLVVTPVSQAAANQRAGRAGRTQPGKTFRLFTAWSFQHELEPNTIPEILRTNMGSVVLLLKSLGINDLINFDFMDRPPADVLIRALEQLYALGALNDRGELTKLGRRMAEFPLDPMLSKAVIVSEKYKCTSEVLSMVGMLSLGSSVFYRPKEKAVHADTARLNFARGGGGDHTALLRCYRDWVAADYSSVWCFENYIQLRNIKKARDIREQLEGLCERVEIDHTVSSGDDIEAPLKSMTAGFFYNVAKLGRTGEYQTVKQQKTVYIHPSSVLAKDEEPPAWVCYFELAFTTKEFMRQVAPIKGEWLVEIAPHYYQEEDVETKKKKMPKVHKRR